MVKDSFSSSLPSGIQNVFSRFVYFRFCLHQRFLYYVTLGHLAQLSHVKQQTDFFYISKLILRGRT